jgi:hypothetical protein
VRFENVAVSVRDQEYSQGRFEFGGQSRQQRREDTESRSQSLKSHGRDDMARHNREGNGGSANRERREGLRKRFGSSNTNFERYA